MQDKHLASVLGLSSDWFLDCSRSKSCGKLCGKWNCKVAAEAWRGCLRALGSESLLRQIGLDTAYMKPENVEAMDSQETQAGKEHVHTSTEVESAMSGRPGELYPPTPTKAGRG